MESGYSNYYLFFIIYSYEMINIELVELTKHEKLFRLYTKMKNQKNKIL
jgi:hypothetical protein